MLYHKLMPLAYDKISCLIIGICIMVKSVISYSPHFELENSDRS